MQLALYRLAWARAASIPLDRVTAAFVHVADGITIRADQWTEAQIEARFAQAFVVGAAAPSGS